MPDDIIAQPRTYYLDKRVPGDSDDSDDDDGTSMDDMQNVGPSGDWLDDEDDLDLSILANVAVNQAPRRSSRNK